MFGAEMAIHMAKELNPSTLARPMFAAEPHRLILVLAPHKVKVEKMNVMMLFLMVKLRSIAGFEVALTA